MWASQSGTASPHLSPAPGAGVLLEPAGPCSHYGSEEGGQEGDWGPQGTPRSAWPQKQPWAFQGPSPVSSKESLTEGGQGKRGQAVNLGVGETAADTYP